MYHVVFVPKYRRRVLQRELVRRLTHLFYDVDRNTSNNGQDGRIDKISYPSSLATLLLDLPLVTASSGGNFATIFAGVVR